MNKLKSLALLALAAFGLSVHGATTTNDWWSVKLDDDFQAGFVLEGEGLGSLTNDLGKMDNVVQPYASGVWSMIDGDESYVTNGLATNWVNNTMTEVLDTTYIKLDTQGNDLTWTPTNGVADNIIALVDADLLLVGSDSPPDSSDFDASGDVHTAIYLKNEIEEESGDTTNSVLCVYVYNSDTGVREWQPLDGIELEDNAWAHVQVVMNYADESNPKVQVFVNGTKMHALGDAEADEWTAAIKGSNTDAFKLSSVAFRGTGAVDNFVGEAQEVSVDTYEFTAEVYKDNVLVQQGSVGNVSRTTTADVGTSATFPGFEFHDYSVVGTTTNEATFVLTRIEFINQANGAVTAIDYTYQDHQVTPDNSSYVVFTKGHEMIEDPETGDMIEGEEYQSGTFNVLAPTDGATSNAVIAKIYFETIGGPRYDITFKPENGQIDIVTNVAAGATAYAPADPVLAGFTFQGWTNALDATDATLYSNANLPAAAANATYAAKYEAAAATKPEVDAGDGLAGYNAQHPDAPVAPIAFATPEGGQEDLCNISFVAPEAGWYFLYTSTTVAGPYNPDYRTKKQVTAGSLVTLTEYAAGTTKFFKIGWSSTEPVAE